MNIASLNFSSANVLPLDLDGNGLVDLTYLSYGTAPQVFSALVSPTAASWQRQASVTATSLFTQLDVASERGLVNVVDVNGDGAVDVVYTAPTGIQTYLSLSPWVGGNGTFGSSAASASGVTLSASPIEACTPTACTPILFSYPNVHIADMNGDGLPDLVRVHSAEVLYWPGRGDGHWGTEDRSACTYGQALSSGQVTMTSAPSLASLSGISLADVNGDGLSDLVQVAATSVTVWLNTNGAGFVAGTGIPSPVVETNLAHVQLVDVNGNGTADIVWADGGNYRYIDLLGGARPWLLTHVANGYGKTTDITYGTSSSEMLAAAAAGKPWTATAPIVVPIVKTLHRKRPPRPGGPRRGPLRDDVHVPGRRLRRKAARLSRIPRRDRDASITGDTNRARRSVTETHFLDRRLRR